MRKLSEQELDRKRLENYIMKRLDKEETKWWENYMMTELYNKETI